MSRLRSRDTGPVLVLTAVAALLYATFALVRHLHWGSGLDVGIFSQAIWHYGNLETPLSTLKGGGNLLGDHFHPLIALLAPVSWIGAESNGLLVAQALLVAASIVPVWVFARERLDRWPAFAIALAYALFWGVWAGVEFEFHELAFAPLPIALAILWGERRQWVRFGCALAVLLLVKEDMGMLVLFYGIWLLSRREWRAGAITAVSGLAAYFVVTEILIPHFAGGTDFAYWSYDRIGSDVPDAVANVITNPWLPFQVALDDGQKLRTLGAMLAPFLLLPLCSRISILALPIVAERMLSSNDLYWGIYFYYTLPLAPILAMAAAAGLANVAPLVKSELRSRVVLGAATLMVLLNVVLNEVAADTGSQFKYYAKDPSWAPAARRTVDSLPPNASVVTQDFVYPHLSTRAGADIVRPGVRPAEYLVFNPFVQPGSSATGYRTFGAYGRGLRGLIPGYRTVRLDDGWVVMKRRVRGDPSAGVIDARACAALARRAQTEGRSSDATATVRLLCRPA